MSKIRVSKIRISSNHRELHGAIFAIDFKQQTSILLLDIEFCSECWLNVNAAGHVLTRGGDEPGFCLMGGQDGFSKGSHTPKKGFL